MATSTPTVEKEPTSKGIERGSGYCQRGKIRSFIVVTVRISGNPPAQEAYKKLDARALFQCLLPPVFFRCVNWAVSLLAEDQRVLEIHWQARRSARKDRTQGGICGTDFRGTCGASPESIVEEVSLCPGVLPTSVQHTKQERERVFCSRKGYTKLHPSP